MEKIIEKAWYIHVSNLIEPWYYNDIQVYAETRGEARSKGLREIYNMGASKDVDRYEDNGVYYIDVKATRQKECDIIDYNGNQVKRKEIEQLKWVEERDKKALDLTISNPNDLAVVYAGCYSQYWGANNSGYSSSIFFAGKYTTKEAYDIVKGSDYGRKEEVRLLDVANFNHKLNQEISTKQREIDRLKSLII